MCVYTYICVYLYLYIYVYVIPWQWPWLYTTWSPKLLTSLLWQGSTAAHAPCQLLGGDLVPSLSAQKMQGHSKACQSPASIVTGGAYPSAWEAGQQKFGRMGDGRCGLWEMQAAGSQWCLTPVHSRSSPFPSELVISPLLLSCHVCECPKHLSVMPEVPWSLLFQ